MRAYYGEKEEDEEESGKKRSASTDIAGPISAWMILLFVALAVRFVISSGTFGTGSTGGIAGTLASASSFILFAPGDVILPLVIGAAIGAEVGIKANSLKKAEKAGALNGVYASIVYIIGIIVIYEILGAVFPSVAPSFSFLITSWVAVPVVVCTALSEIFAVLSYSRKVGS